LREKIGMRGNITALLYSPHPNPLQQEREPITLFLFKIIV
jgi:hypothetical protein